MRRRDAVADGTKIEWTDATVNAVNGCSVISPGCKHCYAMKQAHRFPVRQGLTMKTAGGMVWTGDVRFNEKALLQPLGWTRPRRIFWNAHGDLFHENVPDEWIDKVLAVCALTPQHQHQILTKRSARMRAYFSYADGFGRWGFIEHQARRIANVPAGRTLAHLGGSHLPNVWLGVSVEDQQRADERIPDLLATPAAVRFLSCEPLLGPVNLDCVMVTLESGERVGWNVVRDGPGDRVDWVIVGGESGPGARAMHPDWARQLRAQCDAADVPFFFKQWGEWLPCESPANPVDGVDLRACDGFIAQRVGKKSAGRLLDGVEHNGMPA